MRPVEHPPRRIVAVVRAQATTGLVQVPVDGVLGQSKLAGDFLGAHVAIDESKAFALTLGEAIKAGARALKLFPAGTFGPGHLKAVKDVLPREVAVYAVGGVGAGNLDAWRSAGVDGIGVGGELYRPGDGAADVAERAARLVTAWMA